MGRAERRAKGRADRTGKLPPGFARKRGPKVADPLTVRPVVVPGSPPLPGALVRQGDELAGGLGGAAPPVSAAAKDVPATAQGTAADDDSGGPAPLPPHQRGSPVHSDGGSDRGATALPPQVAPERDAALGALRLVLDERNRLTDAERVALQACRDAGVSWSTLAELYGLTRSGAQHRYRSLSGRT
jgi:hypothetical protein